MKVGDTASLKKSPDDFNKIIVAFYKSENYDDFIINTYCEIIRSVMLESFRKEQLKRKKEGLPYKEKHLLTKTDCKDADYVSLSGVPFQNGWHHKTTKISDLSGLSKPSDNPENVKPLIDINNSIIKRIKRTGIGYTETIWL